MIDHKRLLRFRQLCQSKTDLGPVELANHNVTLNVIPYAIAI